MVSNRYNLYYVKHLICMGRAEVNSCLLLRCGGNIAFATPSRAKVAAGYSDQLIPNQFVHQRLPSNYNLRGKHPVNNMIGLDYRVLLILDKERKEYYR